MDIHKEADQILASLQQNHQQLRLEFHPGGATVILCNSAGEHKYEMIPFKDRVVVPVFGTGRQDKHGHEIYAGDIIRTDNEQQDDEPSVDHFFGVVVYDNQRTGYFIKQPHDKYRPSLHNYYIVSIEMVGNIYQHPELLEQQP